MRSDRTWTGYLPKSGTLASTLLLALAVPPFQWLGLIWISLVPWFFSLRRCETIGQAVAQGFWLNLLTGFASTYWVATTAQRYLGVSVSVGLLVLIAHAIVHQLQFVIFGGLYWKTLRAAPPRGSETLALAFLYTGVDWLTPKLFQDTLGVVLFASVPLRQLAAVGGAPLLTFVIILVNVGVYALSAELQASAKRRGTMLRSSRRAAAWLVLPLAVLVIVAMVEEHRAARAIDSADRELRVGIVQGNVSADIKRRWARGDSEAAAESLGAYVRGTRELLDSPRKPDLIVWPETAFPGVFRKPENDAQLRLNVAFDRFLGRAGAPVAFGGYDREERTDRRVLRNALYLVVPEPGQRIDRLSAMEVYHKSILFPVGEYFPFLDERTVRQWLPHSAHLASGSGARVLELPREGAESLRLAPAICYEDLFAGHATELARSDADFLVNISNDAWFGDDGAARWHLMMATLRSIETRLPQVRATNTGHSTFVLANGDLREVTELGERAIRVFDLPISPRAPTLAVRFGAWFGPFSVVLVTIWLISLWRTRRAMNARG